MSALGEGAPQAQPRSHPIHGLSEAEGKEFTARWLPAWTGNDPERLRNEVYFDRSELLAAIGET